MMIPLKLGNIVGVQRPLTVAYHRLRRTRRARWLRECYRELLEETPRSLDERVRFHMDHLIVYWQRCEGFLEIARNQGLPVAPSFLVADWVLFPLVGSGIADYDMRAFGAERAPSLVVPWNNYTASLRDVRHGVPTPETAVLAASVAFARVRAAYDTLHI